MKRKEGSATTAAVGVVVFLLVLLASGCESMGAVAEQPASGAPARRQRRVDRYSKIPSNYPASWQTATGGQ